MPAPSSVPLAPEHVPMAAGVLARAFEHDPFYAWMIPSPSDRLQALEQYFADKLHRAVDQEDGVVLLSATTTSVLVAERSRGAAPDDSPLSTGAREILQRWVSPRHLQQIEEVMAVIPHVTAPHVYLDLIGTAPEARGRGEGGVLPVAWLERVTDEEVRLDSSNTANLSFYRRLGFVPTGRIQLPHGAGALTPMRLVR